MNTICARAVKIAQLIAATLILLLSSSSAIPAEIVVRINGYYTTPDLISVKAGDTVTWLVEDQSFPHVVKSFSGDFLSPTLNQGQSFSTVLQAPGTISYRHYSSPRGQPGGILYVSPAETNSPITITTPITGSVFAFTPSWNQTYWINILATSETETKTIERVEYYSASTLIGVATNAPYWLLWTNAPVGTNSVTVKQVNRDATVTVSPPVSLIVEELETQRVRNARILPGGVFAFDYSLPYGPGARFQLFDFIDGVEPIYINALQSINTEIGFGTILSEIGTNQSRLFSIKERF